MTVERWCNIFLKECMTIRDFEELYEMDYNSASKVIRDIKKEFAVKGKKLRLDICGRLHTLDYFDWTGDANGRYSVIKEYLEELIQWKTINDLHR